MLPPLLMSRMIICPADPAPISMTLLRQRIMTELKPCGSARAKYFIELAVSLGYLLKDGNKYSASDKLFKNLLTEDDNEEEEVPF